MSPILATLLVLTMTEAIPRGDRDIMLDEIMRDLIRPKEDQGGLHFPRGDITMENNEGSRVQFDAKFHPFLMMGICNMIGIVLSLVVIVTLWIKVQRNEKRTQGNVYKF